MEQPQPLSRSDKRQKIMGFTLYFVFFGLFAVALIKQIHPIWGIVACFLACLSLYASRPVSRRRTTFQRRYLAEQDEETQQKITRLEHWHIIANASVLAVELWVLCALPLYLRVGDTYTKLAHLLHPDTLWMLPSHPTASVFLLAISSVVVNYGLVLLIFKHAAGEYYLQWREYYTNGRSETKRKRIAVAALVGGIAVLVSTALLVNSYTIITKDGVTHSSVDSFTSNTYQWSDIKKFEWSFQAITLVTNKGNEISFSTSWTNDKNLDDFISGRTGLEASWRE